MGENTSSLECIEGESPSKNKNLKNSHQPYSNSSHHLMTRQFIRSVAVISLFTLGSRILGFMRTLLISYFLGASAASDALSIAIKLPSLFRRLFAEGAFNASFIPLFSGRLAQKGPQSAHDFAQEIFSFMWFSMAIFVGVSHVLLPYVLPIILSGFQATPERLMLTIAFSKITFPFLFFITLAALYGGILNSYERFGIVAAGPMVGNTILITVSWFALPFVESPGYALAWGVLACGVTQWAWVYYPLKSMGVSLQWRIPKWSPKIKDFFLKMAPAAAGSGVVQINIFLDMWMASRLKEGHVSYLDYAERLNQLPLSLIGIAIGTALLPLLTKQLRSGKKDEAIQTQNTALKYSLLFTMPAMVALMVIPVPLIQVAYEHGCFTKDHTLATAYALMAFSSGLPAYMAIKVFSSMFFARYDTKTPLWGACIAVALNLVLNFLLIGPLGHIGLALATSIAAWVNCIYLGWKLKKRGYYQPDPKFKSITYRLIFLSGILGIAWWTTNHIWGLSISNEKPYQIAYLSILIALGIFIYILGGRILKIFSWTEMAKNLKKQ